MKTKHTIASGAVISPCGRYRYRLWRAWEPHVRRRVAFILLNPSIADEAVDDPTVRKCMKYAQAWGYDALDVANLFALRSTDPAALYHSPSPVGPDNDRHLVELAARASIVVCGWGNNGALMNRGRDVLAMLRAPHLPRPHALFVTGDGHPHHPLYLPDNAPPVDLVVARKKGVAA